MSDAKKKPFFVPQEMQVQPQQAQKAEVSVPTPLTTEQPESTIKKTPESPYLPTIVLKNVPSKFLAYPKGVEISYQPYKFGELKKFSQSKLSLKQRYEFILDGIIVSGMDKMQITFNDFLYIALLRKMSSIGVHDVQITFNCGKCGFENKHHVQLDKLDFDEIQVPELPAHLSINGKDLTFTPLTVGDFFTLFREGKENDAVGILAVQCRSHHFKEAYDIIFGANTEDSELLEELNKVFYHGLATMKIPCINKEATVTEVIDGLEIEKTVHCDYVNKIELGSPELIVQPFRGPGGATKNRLRFGNGDAHKSN